MNIIIRPHWNKPNSLLVIIQSKGHLLCSDPIRMYSDPCKVRCSKNSGRCPLGNVRFVVILGKSSHTDVLSRQFDEVQNELSVLLGTECHLEIFIAEDGLRYSMKVLATNIIAIVKLLDITHRIQLLYHENKMIREFISQNYRASNLQEDY